MLKPGGARQRVGLALPDKLPAKLHTLFVGINPAVRSAEVGHYYAHPTNMFWRLLSDAGFWNQPLRAEDDDRLVKAGFGFTDVAKRPTSSASQLELGEFQEARTRLAAIVRKSKPKTVVFVSKRSARAFMQVGDSHPIKYGRQAELFFGAQVWFVPSSSGQSHADTTFAQKLSHYRKLAKHVSTYHVHRIGIFRQVNAASPKGGPSRNRNRSRTKVTGKGFSRK